MLDPRRLRLLIQLEGLGTVRAVAAAASMSPSAVSQQLAALERESGAALLERHGRSLTLTQAGAVLAAHARDILERIGTAEEALRDLSEAPAGTVRVGAFTSALRAFTIEAARRVRLEHPKLRMHLSELEPHQTVPALVRGDIDLAVVADFGDGALPHTPHLQRTPLATDDLIAVLPAEHPATGRTIRLGELRDDPWVLDDSDLADQVQRRCRQAGFEPAVAGRLSSHGSLLLAVEAGLGVTVLPMFAVDANYAVRIVSLTPAPRRELFALTRQGATSRRSITVALAAIVAVARLA